MANVLDIITLQQYYDFIERSQTSPSLEDDATALGNRITQASSYMEEKTNRPLVPDSEIDVPTDSDGDEIAKYQPYDSPTESASPLKTMTQELELACCLLVRYYGLRAEKMGLTSDSSSTKSDTYNIVFPIEVNNILVKYTYYPVTDYTVGR